MEENQDYNQGTSSMNNKSFRDKSPEEVKDTVKDKVAKGVAAVAGALKGFTEEAQKNDLANSTKEAIQKAGDTTRTLASTAKEEYRSTKETIKPSGGSLSSGSSSSGSTSSSLSDYGSSSSSGSGSSMGASSSTGSTGTGSTSTYGTPSTKASESSEFPTLDKTPKEDEDL